jgi:hypothetical protein
MQLNFKLWKFLFKLFYIPLLVDVQHNYIKLFCHVAENETSNYSAHVMKINKALFQFNLVLGL